MWLNATQKGPLATRSLKGGRGLEDLFIEGKDCANAWQDKPRASKVNFALGDSINQVNRSWRERKCRRV